MATYTAEISWSRGDQDFLGNQYSRKHALRFDAGLEVPGSSSPHVVPVPMSDPRAVDPEEMLVAALSSCHMLWFLSIAAKKGVVVDRYLDAASGVMGKNPQGRSAMTLVTLRPTVEFSDPSRPGPEELERMHQLAHEQCYIANSVNFEVRIEPSAGSL